MTSSHNLNYTVTDKADHLKKEDLVNKNSSECSLDNLSNQYAECNKTEEKVISEALLNFIKDTPLDDQMADFDRSEQRVAADFRKNRMLSLLENASKHFPRNNVTSSVNHEDGRIDPGPQGATCITAENTWEKTKGRNWHDGGSISTHVAENTNDATKVYLPKYDDIFDMPTSKLYHKENVVKTASLDLQNHFPQECITTSVPSLNIERSTAFKQFNANALSSETKVTPVHGNFQNLIIKKYTGVNANRFVTGTQGKQHWRKRGESKGTDRGGNRQKGKRSDQMCSVETVPNSHSSAIGNYFHGLRTSDHLSPHMAKNAFCINKDMLRQHTEKKTVHSPLFISQRDVIESMNVLDKIKHSEAPSPLINCGNTRNAIIGKYFIQHPYTGGYYDMEPAWEQCHSGGHCSQVTQDVAKHMDKVSAQYMGSAGNHCTNVDSVTGIKDVSPVLVAENRKDRLILTNLPQTVSGPPWVSLCDLSMLLSTIINIYLQALEIGNDATKDVCNTLQAVIGLVEETVKGMQICDRVVEPTIVQATTNLTSPSSETLEKMRDIILLQRKRVKQAVDGTQTELKSTDPHASYSKEEISDICRRTKEKVAEQTEKVQWLNNDLKFDDALLKVTFGHSSKEREEMTDILFKDIEKAKEYLKSPITNSDCISKSSTEPLGGATYYMQLMKQCFIIKQSLEKLQYECV